MADRIAISPLARKIAEEKGINLATLRGSGPGGRIIKRDVEGLQQTATPTATPPTATRPSATPASAVTNAALPDPRLYAEAGRYDTQELNPMQRAIAQRLTLAKQSMPHFYLTRRLEVGALLTLRQTINEALAARGEKLSVNDFIIRAVALALIDEPEVNVSFADTEILRHHHADIGVAVALPDGLITPIIREAENKSVQQISAEVKSLAAKAADRHLKPLEYEGGSFSISNLGMFNIDSFTAVINPPQAAILAVGTTQERLYRDPDGNIQAAQDMQVTLSCDHRAINGAVGARFLQTLADYCKHPHLMMFA
jgi:pyruvate dehydrogenase E2 component (dihydrolipoamide acetyltransferase)